MDISTDDQLNLFSEPSDEDREKCGKLLIKIFKKIIENPNVPKYRNLNFQRISKKLEKYKICIDSLFSVGFKKSNDGQRLVLDHDHVNKLRSIYQTLQFLISRNNLNTAIMALPDIAKVDYDKIVFDPVGLPCVPLSNVKQQMNLQTRTFKYIDDTLGRYYEKMGIKDYFNIHQQGRFLRFIIDEELDDVDLHIDGELGPSADPNNCVYSSFDEQFPMYRCIMNLLDERPSKYVNKNTVIFFVLQHCYKTHRVPTGKYIIQQLSRICQSNVTCVKAPENIASNEHHDYIVSTNECGAVSVCEHLHSLTESMNEYHGNNEDKNDNDAITVLDHYLHLMQEHDDEFQVINAAMGYCDIARCKIFARNHRDRNINVQRKKLYFHSENVAYLETLDKIHCYYFHSYDIGNKKPIAIPSNEETKSEDKKSASYSNHKMDNYHWTKSKCDRYNIDTFKWGELFIYGYDDENKNFFGKIRTKEIGIKISPKYASLKRELISNKLAVISIEQYESEYNKANIHFDTFYRKRCYPNISIQHLLSFMIYCNYDNLQRCLTKTYYENIEQHNNFYHLAKYLKQGVEIFGTEFDDGIPVRFYHGINQPLSIEKKDTVPIIIASPLSTSTSKEVAANFANSNNGIVVQFASPLKNETPIGASKYFNVSWLSDFGSELEHLFVQSGILSIENIIMMQTGVEMKPVLDAIRDIDGLLDGHTVLDANGDSNCELIRAIIQHQLSYTLPDFQPFRSLDPYAEHLINNFVNNKKYVVIHYGAVKACWSFLSDLLLDKDSELIRLENICAMLPNMERLRLHDINVCSLQLSDILKGIKDKTEKSKLKDINLYDNGQGSTLSDAVVSEYQQLFYKIGWVMQIHVMESKEYRYSIEKITDVMEIDVRKMQQQLKEIIGYGIDEDIIRSAYNENNQNYEATLQSLCLLFVMTD